MLVLLQRIEEWVKFLSKEQNDLYDVLYPKTAKEALEVWDKGNNIFTIELGGFGPGYEQAIHIGVFELIRSITENKKDEKILRMEEIDSEIKDQLLDKHLFKISEKYDLGLSGAQAGAIKRFTHLVLIKGWHDVVTDKKYKDRLIQVSKNWPKYP